MAVSETNLLKLKTLIDDYTTFYNAASNASRAAGEQMTAMHKLYEEMKHASEGVGKFMPHDDATDFTAIKGYEDILKQVANDLRWLTVRY